MAVYNYATYELDFIVPVSRSCDSCGCNFVFEARVKEKVSGSSRGYGAEYTKLAEMRATAARDAIIQMKIEQAQNIINQGILCPRCSRFIGQARQHYFPQGERLAAAKLIEEYYKRFSAVDVLFSVSMAIVIVLGLWLALSGVQRWAFFAVEFILVMVTTIVLGMLLDRRAKQQLPCLLQRLAQMSNAQLHQVIVDSYLAEGETLVARRWCRDLVRKLRQ
ncbi:MAG: hypothetical protein IT440_14260 [Phycisphaeraceae bacterium]|nr:hypothetical protein [Phycisphaeraceae bacterium]